MARFNASHFRSQMNRAQSQLRQASNKAIRDLNTAQRELKNLNNQLRRYQTSARSNQRQLESEVRRLQSSSSSMSTRRVSYRSSTTTLYTSFERVVEARDEGLVRDASLVTHAEFEAANGVTTYNLLSAPGTRFEQEDEDEGLRESGLTSELTVLGGDLDRRWRGAVFALSPHNPEAARHFSSSAREILIDIVDGSATDADVLADDPTALRTPNGSVSRRARIKFCLKRKGETSERLADFVEQDIENVIGLFAVLNEGTHGEAGIFDFPQLSAVKTRTEEAIRFIARIATA